MAYVTTLTSTDLEFGKKLTQELREGKFPYRGVFWLYDDESADWQLVVVTSLVDDNGRRDTYLALGKFTSRIPGDDLRQIRVTVMSPETPLYKALASVLAPAASVEGTRLRNTTVNGITIPEAYLYEIH